MRGMYDLVFAYEDGDPERPRFSAGLGLFLADEVLLRLQGRDLLEVARGHGRRGVRAALRGAARRAECASRSAIGSSGCISSDGRVAAIIALWRSATRASVLERVDGLPCFPARASAGAPRAAAGRRDFDDVVLATSLGAVPAICAELLERLGALARDGRRRGHRADAVAAGVDARGRGRARLAAPRAHGERLRRPVRHVRLDEPRAPARGLAADDPPRALGYFCSVLPARPDADARRGERRTRSWTARSTRSGRGFALELVVARYARANVAPSDRYVQSLPGTGRCASAGRRLGLREPVPGRRLDRVGLDAGCVEAAVLAGRRRPTRCAAGR